MCGIIGAVSREDIVPLLLDGLHRLEYRGYDSAGVAVLNQGDISFRKSAGKVSELERLIAENPLAGRAGISHTRWATHGPPTQTNAHPHVTTRVALVHNGIIENHRILRAKLADSGRRPRGESDSEVLALLIDRGIELEMSPYDATRWALAQVEGSYAVAMIFADNPDVIVAARHGSPLSVCVSDQGAALASDPMALPLGSGTFFSLADGDVCLLRKNRVEVLDSRGRPATRPAQSLDQKVSSSSKGQHKHYMHKEIFEQTKTIPETVASTAQNPAVAEFLGELDSLTLLACGTSYHAGLVAAQWLEDLAGIPTEVELASEFRYRKRAVRKNHGAIFISQSGETADTLAALKSCKNSRIPSVAVVNVAHSTMAQVADRVLVTQAGQEIGVASTKAFTAQLAALFQLALDLGKRRGTLSSNRGARLSSALRTIQQDVAVVLEKEPELRAIARRIARSSEMFIIGRGTMHAMALEAALKIKETSYIHAEGFAAGELKHGTIALIEPGTPVLVLSPHCEIAQKTKANAAEVACRGAEVTFLESEPGEPECSPGRLRLPHVPEELAPFVFAPALQLISYYAAVECKTDVDQPRNLAKSVTVE